MRAIALAILISVSIIEKALNKEEKPLSNAEGVIGLAFLVAFVFGI